MKRLLLALCIVCIANLAQAQTTDEVRARSNAGGKRWDFWTNKQNVQVGLARETGRPIPQFNNNTRGRRGFLRRRR